MPDSHEAETETTYDDYVCRMVYWRNIQSVFLLTLIFIPSLLFLTSPQTTVELWALAWAAFVAAHLRRVYYRRLAEAHR